MPVDHPTPPPPAPIPGSSSTDMGATPKFIGAVQDEWQLYSDRADDYTIGDAIGFGASSIVYQAKWKPKDSPTAQPTPCALKVLDLDLLPPRSLQLLQRETTLMSLSKHPNVLRVRGSWIQGHRLFIALRLMSKGSAADVMRYGWPGGMEEEVVKCILRQALKGLNYLHINGFIHRDIKAANLLIDDDGTVLLGDLGVAADLSEDPHHHISSGRSRVHSTPAVVALAPHHTAISIGSKPKDSTANQPRPKMGKRKSFVGTPCWMAPELIQGKQYDASADIWSFGITALELSQGHPPRFRESPQRVLLRTLQEDPPTLDRDGATYKYSRAFKDMIDACLHKDPSKRPTAEQLLQTPLFRSAKKKSYLVNAILKNLPPLTQRQERRALSPALSPSSVDSWDFPTTMGSPTISNNVRYAALQELVAAEDRARDVRGDDDVFEFDGDVTPSRARFSIPTTTGQERPSFDLDNDHDHEQCDDDQQDLSSSPPDTSSLGGTSGPSSTREISTAPSSYLAPSSMFSRKSESASANASRPSTSHSSASDSATPENTISGPTIPSQSTAPELSKESATQKTLVSASSDSELGKRIDKTTRRKDSGLWKKLKSGLTPSGSLRAKNKGSSVSSSPGSDSPLSRSLTRGSILSLGGFFSSSNGNS